VFNLIERKTMHKINAILLVLSFGINAVYSAQMAATVKTTGNNSQTVGEVVFTETPYGLLITPDLTNLPPGAHGFHLHKSPNCGHEGNDAGAHLDPANSNSHLGPYGKGHLGDLPVLYVFNDGKATIPLLAPRLKLKDLKDTALMIHANGDNYSDNPPLGGGGDRIACGVIK
jgi:Cu-Zn family superoxide dismutase